MSQGMFKFGLLTMVVATGLAITSNGFASEAQRVDVIDHLPTEGVQVDSMKSASLQSMRVDVIGSIRAQGPVYPSTSGSMRVDVIDSIRAQGPGSPSTSGS